MRETRFALAIFLISSLFSVRCALAAPYGEYLVTPSRFKGLSVLDSNPRLKYYGGPVISHAKVFVIYWSGRVRSKIKARIGLFYRSILDSGYMDVLSQYRTDIPAVDGREGTGQTIGRGRWIGERTIKPRNESADLTNAMIQKELASQISSGVLPAPDADTLYMIYFPSGVKINGPLGSDKSCEDFGGYHDGFSEEGFAAVFYGVIPDCSPDFAAITMVSSHEMLEAITDPFPTPGSHPAYPQAWNSIRGEEVVDLCENSSSSYVSGRVNSMVERPWDNSAGVCAKGHWISSAASRSVAIQASVPLVLKALSPLAAGFIWKGR